MRVPTHRFGLTLRRRRSWSLALVAAVALTVATACGSPPVEHRNDLVIGRILDLTTLDPSRSLCDTCQIYLSAVYDTLVKANSGDGSLEPLIATKWAGNADNTEFTFTLNPEAKFADGSPIEAKDVKWSWDRIKNLQGSPSYFMTGIASVEAPDAHTVVVRSTAPNSAFPNIASASYMGIINSDLASQNGATAGADAATTDKAEQWFLKNSAGSGQYELDSYAEGSQLVLKRNPNYWAQQPSFDKVTVKEVSEPAAQLQQLQQGDIDIAMNVSFDSLDQLKSNPNLATSVNDSFNFVYIALSPGVPGGEALQNPKVRDAIRSAINYEAVINATVAGNGNLQSTGIANGFEGTKELPLPKYDPVAAKKLLSEAGFPQGLELTATYPNYAIYGVNFSTMFQAIQQSLKEAGVNLTLKPIEYSQWSDMQKRSGIPMTASYFAPDHPDTVQYAQFFSLGDKSVWAERARMPVRPVETELIARALRESGAQRVATYTDLGTLMYEDAIILPVVNPKVLLANSTDIEGNNYHITRNLDLSVLKFKD
jgi:peptide/nickel transport system substrate-binding protein